MRAFARRVATIDPALADFALASAAIVELELQWWLGHALDPGHRTLTAIASFAFAAPIAIRRRAPSIALVVAASVAMLQALFGGQLLSGSLSLTSEFVPLLVLLALAYTAGAIPDSGRSAAALVISLALVIASGFLPGAGPTPSGVGEIAQSIAFSCLQVVPAWFVGRLTRLRSHRSAAFRELAAQAALARDALRDAAVADERARIGTELQDIIAHSISVMVVQAGSARLLVRRDPERARDSILNVEHTGREALADLRRLLGMLHKGDDPRALTPQPGLKQLPALISATEFVCELRTLGDPMALTPGVDLVAYRVIETSLATAARHGVAHALVSIRYAPDELELEVTGDRAIAELEQELDAITQRVVLYDGTVRTGTQPNRGFAIAARLPIGAVVPG